MRQGRRNLKARAAGSPRVIAMALTISLWLSGEVLAASSTAANTEKLQQGISFSDPLNALDQLIEVGLDFTQTPMDVRRASLDKAQELLISTDDALPKLRAEFALADAYLNYQSGDLQAAIAAIGPGLAAVSPASHPNLYVRLQSLLGGLFLTAGEREKGLKTLETLFEQSFANVDQLRIENARVNYASGLVQNGRINEASQSYEQALVFALSAGEDLLALSAGSNYISLLRDQGMSAKAEYWLDRLRPAMEKEPKVMATAALVLYDYALMLGRGEASQVTEKLEMLLARPKPMPALVQAHAQELYSEALRAQSRLTESLTAGERAATLLAAYPVEQPEALMNITRTLLAMKNYRAAGQKLEALAQLAITKPANIAELHKLRLQHALGANEDAKANRAFSDYIGSNQALVDFMNQQQTDYFQQKLDQEQTQRELERSREEQSRLTAEAALQKAQANEARMREETLRQQRGVIVAAVVLLSLIGIALVYLNARRQLQVRLRQSLREQNASLSELVNEKSEDLVRNVTEQAQLKAALAERRHMEAIGQIAGHVAHDFNNVLQVISAANELLAFKVQGEVETSALQASSQSVQSAASRVRQLLAYSRNQHLEARVFGVSDFLRDNQALFDSAVGDVNHLAVKDECGNALVKLDAGQLTAAIINLLRNAAEAMDTPGNVALNASIVSADDQLLQLQVNDNGRGMTAQELEQAAGPYYTTKEAGTGLGLSSVYGFALQSGGKVVLNSDLGVGTQVALQFPIYAAAVDSSTGSESTASTALRGARVLVVEDNKFVAKTLLAVLDDEGAETHWASSTEEAQSLLSSERDWDLLLSDVKVPGPFDGFGLANWVRSTYPQIQIGLMSGYGPSADTDHSFPVLSKPFRINELLDFLNAESKQPKSR